MRSMNLLATLLLFTLAGAAQSSSPATQNQSSAPFIRTFKADDFSNIASGESNQNRILQLQQGNFANMAPQRFILQDGMAQAVDNHTCYTMRSYLFERKDGEAPEMVGMTTCTPAKRNQLHRVQPFPKGRLVPATGAVEK